MSKLIKLFFSIFVVSVIGCDKTVNNFVIIEFPEARINFFIEGATDLNEIRVLNNTDAPATQTNRRVLLKGAGLVLYKDFHVHYNKKYISLGQEVILNDTQNTSNYILTSDGNLKPGFFRDFD